MDVDVIIVKEIFCDMFNRKKDDILAGRVKFFNPPESWTDKQLNLTAMNLVLISLADQSSKN